MKETDYSVIQQEISSQLLENEWSILEYLESDKCIIAICNIYTTNDLVSGFGQDYKYEDAETSSNGYKKLSIISSAERISIITDSKMSYYKTDLPICGYESLEQDIFNILMVIQAVLDRMESQ